MGALLPLVLDRGPAAILAVLLVVACWMRVVDLDHVPGINGDEAWYGVQLLRIQSGEPFAWRTPTGNLLNPFYFGLLAAVHAILPPSFWALRLPAAISGLATLALNFSLCRRVFDRRTAAVTTLGLAVLPINLAYSRFGWDSCQSVAAVLVATYSALAALQRRPGYLRWLSGSLLASLAAVLIHPTNVFVVPLVVTLACWPVRRSLFEQLVWLLSRRSGGLAWGALGALACLGVWGARPWLGLALLRAGTLWQYPAFAQGLLGLLSGTSTLEFIPGVPSPDLRGASGWWPTGLANSILSVVAAAAIGCGVYGWYRSYRHQPRDQRDLPLTLGVGAMLGAFFLIAGPEALAPHYERYGLVLVGPCLLWLARGWVVLGAAEPVPANEHARAVGPANPGNLASHATRSGAAKRSLVSVRERSRAWCWTGLIAAALCLACFWQQYFQVFYISGGESHLTFHTGAREPKAAAWQQLLRQAPRRAAPACVLAPEWWNYWPLAYLAWSHPHWHVLPTAEIPLGSSERYSAVWRCVFADATQAHRTETESSSNFVRDAAGRPVLVITPVAHTQVR